MKILLAAAAFLFAPPASRHDYIGQDRQRDADCKGVVHGVVLGQDDKPWSGIGVILEPVGDYDYVLPHAKTDEHGQYRFSDVSCGSWGVFVRDKEAGYPQSGRLINSFLYGGSSPEVRITDENLDAQLNISVPLRPGKLVVYLTNRSTRARIPRIELELRVNRKRWQKDSCADSESSTCGDHFFLVPPDQDVKLRIMPKGFHEWKESAGRGTLIHLSAGELMTIDVELDPIRN